MVAPALVLLHGWGGNSRSWGEVGARLAEFGAVTQLDLPGYGDQPALADPSLTGHIDWLLGQLPAQSLLVGFSFGGMLALAAAAERPETVIGVVTVASNLSFVARPEWPAAMSQHDFDAFLDGYQQRPAATLARFSALASSGQRAVIKQLTALAPLAPEPAAGAAQLALLGELSLLGSAERLATSQTPVTMLFAGDDQLVPIAAAEQVAARFPQFNQRHCAGSHLIPLAEPALIVEVVEQMVADQQWQPQLDKRAVAGAFSRAAPAYAAAAQLQARVAADLLECAASDSGSVRRVVDLGCASGVQLPALTERFNGAEIVAIDIAPGMLAEARRCHPDHTGWLCADAEQLPLASGCVEQLYSSFALQWCQQLEQLAAELARVVEPGGELLLAVPVAGTLAELRAAWAAVDELVHVNQFATPQRWCGALAAAGFVVDQLAVHQYSEHHSSVRALLQSIKAVGAHNSHRERSRKLTGRERIAALYDHYPTAADGSCTGHWQVLLGRAVRR